MKIVAFIQMHNESSKGHLVRCLENCRQWADDIAIYDDGSTDDSIEVAGRYTSHILRGEHNNQNRELFHKQELLDYVLDMLAPSWIMWLDCDEVLDRQATTGALRETCEFAETPGNVLSEVQAFSFHELNLWRSETYVRVDTLFDKGWFVRLWRVTPGMRFDVHEGVHQRLYPITIENEKIQKLPFRVIHYGFADYLYVMRRIGVADCSRDELIRIAKDNWILNEENCLCFRVPDETFPVENVTAEKDKWPIPEVRNLRHLRSYAELTAELTEAR